MRRILHLIDTVGTGGAEQMYLSLIRHLSDDAWSSIPAIGGPGWLKDQLVSDGYEPVELPTGGSFDHSWLRGIRGLVQRLQIDLVQCHLQGSSVYAGLAVLGLGVPVVGTFHGLPDLLFQGYRGRLKALGLRISGVHLVMVSRWLRDRAQEEGSLDRCPVHVIHNGLSASWFDGPPRVLPVAPPLPDRPLRILSIGNVLPAKNYETLLRAVRLLLDWGANLSVNIAGETSRDERYYRSLLELRDQLRIPSGTVSFMGYVEDVNAVLRSHHLYVLASREESFSLAVAEAMAAGLPVIASRCGGPEELLEDGASGLLFDVADFEGLAKSILRLASDHALGRNLASRGLEVAAGLSMRETISGYEELYGRLLNEA